MTVSQPTSPRRARRATIILWSTAVALLIASAAILTFSTWQQMDFYRAQMAPEAVNVRPSFWLQVAWSIQPVPGALLLVGLVCAVAPFFLFAVVAGRRLAIDTTATVGDAVLRPDDERA